MMDKYQRMFQPQKTFKLRITGPLWGGYIDAYISQRNRNAIIIRVMKSS